MNHVASSNRRLTSVRKPAALAEALEKRLALASFTVFNTNDAGAGSFRQAVIDANVAATADTINFDTAGTFATPQIISLQSALPQISNAGGELTITGTGATKLTIRRDPGAATNFRILDSLAPSLTLTNFTLSGGNATNDGGGLQASGIITLDGMVLSGNRAMGSSDGGAIRVNSGGFLTVHNSTISGNNSDHNGGGIYFFNNGSLLMEDTTISGNSTSLTEGEYGGGGIYFFGTASPTPPPGFTPSTLVVRNSTIANNTSGASGGGIQLRSFTGTLLIQNSTISGNMANDTAVGLGGGGIARTSGSGTITVANSVLSSNTNPNAPDILSTGTVHVNFSAVGSPTGFTLSASSSNNLPFGSNLMLGALANNGGPTQTRLPQAGSELINAGSNALVPSELTTDQRGAGFTRISAPTVDIGAVERDDIAPTIETSQFSFLTAPQSLIYVFSEDVSDSLTVSDLLLENLTTSSTISAANIALGYNAATNSATLTFPGFTFGALPDGNYRATLVASGIADPSGNPIAANDVELFFFLQADANHDARVSLIDFNTLAGNFGAMPATFAQGDFNYDAKVNLIDFNILAGRFGNMLGPEAFSAIRITAPKQTRLIDALRDELLA